MLKRILLLSAIALSACGDPSSHNHGHETEDNFLTQLQADYPVTLSKVGDKTWVHTTNYTLPGQNPIPSNGLVYIDGDEVTLIDGAWGELATLSLIEKVKAETGLPVTKMIVTHHHADRTAGVDAAEYVGVEIITHPDTPALAARSGWPAPNTSVAALLNPGSRTKVGTVEVAYPGPGHAVDNLVVYIPSEKILYGGCAVRGAGTKSLGNIRDADLETWPKSLQWTKSTYKDAVLVVPGHGKGSTLSLIDGTLKLLSEASASDETDEAP